MPTHSVLTIESIVSHRKKIQITPYEILGWMGIVVAFIVALFLASNLNLERISVVWMLVFGITSTYIFNVIQLFFRKSPEHSLYHYFILLIAISAGISISADIPFAALCDSLLISFSIIAGFGRIGCLTAGCCYGKRSANRRFPTQILESAFHFINAGTGIYVSLCTAFTIGDIGLTLTASYAIFRFIIEFFRGDERPFFLKLSEAQWIAVVLLVVISIFQLNA